jgi:hypothetical protein
MRSSKPPDETNQTPPAVETPPAAPPAPPAPPTAVPPVAPPPVPPAAPLTAPPGPAKVELTSDQLKQRLDESRVAGKFRCRSDTGLRAAQLCSPGRPSK